MRLLSPILLTAIGALLVACGDPMPVSAFKDTRPVLDPAPPMGRTAFP